MSKRTRYLSIRWKMILVVAGTLVLSFVTVAIVVRGIVYDSIIRNKRTTVEILTASMVHDIKYTADSDVTGNVPEVIAKYMTYYRIIQQISFYDGTGTAVADSDPDSIGRKSEDPTILAAVSVAKPSLDIRRPSRDQLSIRSVAPVLRGSRLIGAVDIEVSIVDLERTLSAIDQRIALMLGITVLSASMILFLAFRKVILRRLSRLIAVTHEIAAGNYEIRVSDRSNDEIGELAAAFDKMTGDLRRSKQEIEHHDAHQEERIREATAELQKAYEELKSAQSQLVLNEKMASLGVLVSGVAHEINTPVGAILNVSRHLKQRTRELPDSFRRFLEEPPPASMETVGRFFAYVTVAASAPTENAGWRNPRSIESLLEQHGVENHRRVADRLVKLNIVDPERIAEFIDCLRVPSVLEIAETFGSITQTARITETSSQKIAEIVRALKYYAYADKDRMEPIQINESIEIALVLLRTHLKNRVDVVTQYADDLPVVMGTSEIHQVWTNLLSNASDAIAEMGDDYKGLITIMTSRSADTVQVTIADNGSGIPSDKQDRIFDPFVTTKDIGKGTGLGLSIVSGIVKKLNGTVSVTSRRGATAFTVALPLTEAVARSDEGLGLVRAGESRLDLPSAA